MREIKWYQFQVHRGEQSKGLLPFTCCKFQFKLLLNTSVDLSVTMYTVQHATTRQKMNEVAGSAVLVQSGQQLWGVQTTNMKCNPTVSPWPLHCTHTALLLVTGDSCGIL